MEIQPIRKDNATEQNNTTTEKIPNTTEQRRAIAVVESEEKQIRSLLASGMKLKKSGKDVRT